MRPWLAVLYWSWVAASALVIAYVLVIEARRAWRHLRNWWLCKRELRHLESYRAFWERDVQRKWGDA